MAQDKSTALLYKQYLDEFGMVNSEVLISPPDDRQGNEEVEGDNPQATVLWKKMMTRFGSERSTSGSSFTPLSMRTSRRSLLSLTCC